MKVATNATKNCDILYLAKRELWLPQKIYFIINFAEGAQDWASFVLQDVEGNGGGK